MTALTAKPGHFGRAPASVNVRKTRTVSFIGADDGANEPGWGGPISQVRKSRTIRAREEGCRAPELRIKRRHWPVDNSPRMLDVRGLSRTRAPLSTDARSENPDTCFGFAGRDAS
jgi:hypothetical protein